MLALIPKQTGCGALRTAVFEKNEKQSDCKPGSVRLPQSAPAIYLDRTSPPRLYRSTLRRVSTDTLGGPPSVAGLHELSAPGVHDRHVTARPVSSYLTFSPLPLPLAGGAVVFFCTTRPSRAPSRYEAGCPVLPGLSSCAVVIRRTRQAIRLPLSRKDTDWGPPGQTFPPKSGLRTALPLHEARCGGPARVWRQAGRAGSRPGGRTERVSRRRDAPCVRAAR